jgi:DNA-binding CsgD family transcriptional regulator
MPLPKPKLAGNTVVMADDGTLETGDPARPRLFGRARERAAVTAAVRSLIAGRGGGLVLRGCHGSGRSRLLESALEDAGPTVRSIRIGGVPAEAALPGAGLHRLTRELQARLSAPTMPAASSPPSPPAPSSVPLHQRFGRGLDVLDVLVRAAGGAPLICLIDDAEDLDPFSLGLLGFAARRLGREPVLMLIATAAPLTVDDPLAGLPTFTLAPLSEAASAELLSGLLEDRDAAEVSDDLLPVLTDLAQGNPLALHELAGALTGAQLRGSEPLPTGLPADGLLRTHHRRLLARMAPPARRVLLIAAAQQPLDLDTLLRAAGRAGLEPGDIDLAIGSGLLRVESGRVEIADRLLRESSYRDAGVAERLATHGILAEVLDHDAHRLDRAWHRALSWSVNDGSSNAEELADELHALAVEVSGADGDRDGAIEDGDLAGASRCLERSSELTRAPGQAAQRLAAAARAAWLGGDVRRARQLLGRARALATSVELRTVVDLLSGEIELRSGTAERADADLTVVADGLIGPRRGPAVTALLRASEVYMLAGDHGRYLSVARRIGRLDRSGRTDETPQTRLMFEQFAGFSALFRGEHRQAAGPLRAVVELAPRSADPSALILATMAAMSLGDEAHSHQLASQAVSEARSRQTGANLPVALEFLAFSEFWRDHYAAASAHAQQGLELATRAGQDNCVAALLAIQALLATLHGDADAALLRAQVAARRADGRGLCRPRALTTWAAARMSLATGRPDGAVAALRAIRAAPGRPGGMHLTIRVMATPDLIEAAVKHGDSQGVAASLATFENWATEMGSRPMMARAARCHALLSEDDGAAEEHFANALSLHDGRDLEFERARTQLLYGRALRRRRRPAMARDHLQEALEVFDGLTARGWAAQARAELRAAGGVSGPQNRLPELTPQQSEIARLVAGGATNREIAAQLFLSPRTVDHHLRNIFVRLGVRSRVELSRLVS